MKAMLLCAGYGTRLGELTREIPKPMLPLNHYPMLAYLIAHLKRQGFDEIAINLHFKPELIQNYFGDGSRFGVKLTYSHEPVLLGTAGGVKNVERFLRAEPAFLVQYGDILTDQDFTVMLRFHRERSALITLLVHQRARSNSVVALDAERRITSFVERPTEEARQGQTSPWVNSGVCVCAPEVLEHIPSNTACDLPRDVFPRLVGTGRLFGFPLSGYRVAVDSPERFAEARAALAQGRCHISLSG
ncbi:MAG: nucleotidyltransferase family protein [Verrucomicrobia bacterium]|nr:nucleotidyltransferase family protein [Verrucomicrobiota bacterium]